MIALVNATYAYTCTNSYNVNVYLSKPVRVLR